MSTDNLIRKISERKARVGITGLGYVGLPLALRFSEVGFMTTGFDIDTDKVKKLHSGKSYINTIPSERVHNAVKSTRFLATSDFSYIKECDAIIICVPTPLNKNLEPDISYITKTLDTILPFLTKEQLIVLESTTYPGTTEEEVVTRVESSEFSVGEDFFVCFSPEREDPGNKAFSTHTIPKVIGGVTKNCLMVGKALYGSIIEKVVPVSSVKVAEMTKLLENIYRAVNIGLVNELKVVADKMGINIWEVIDAASTKPFGFTPFYPGPGLGGHCIPIDPFYLTWKAREYGIHTRFIELAGEVNSAMPMWVIEKTTGALNSVKKALNGSKILVIGISYKKNIDDMRESPSVQIMEHLREKGAELYYHDPYVPTFPKMREHRFDIDSHDLSPSFLKEMDCVIISTDHDCLDYGMIQQNSSLIIDTRGRYREQFNNIVKA